MEGLEWRGGFSCRFYMYALDVGFSMSDRQQHHDIYFGKERDRQDKCRHYDIRVLVWNGDMLSVTYCTFYDVVLQINTAFSLNLFTLQELTYKKLHCP